MRRLPALAARVVVERKLLGLGVAAEARRERRVVRGGGALVLDLEADVEHRVRRRRHVPAALAAHVALQQPVERRVHDADARRGCLALRRRVDLVQRRDEELVRVLLRVTGELGGRAPGRREEAGRAVRDAVPGVYLGVGSVGECGDGDGRGGGVPR